VRSSTAVGEDGTVLRCSYDWNVYALNGSMGALRWRYTRNSVLCAPRMARHTACSRTRNKPTPTHALCHTSCSPFCTLLSAAAAPHRYHGHQRISRRAPCCTA
jgi:hypothetical protein